MTRTEFARLCLPALFLSLVCISYAPAATISLQANLDSLQMVPPNASPSFGSLDATLDDVSGAFSVTLGTYQDLLGGSLQVFLNDAPAGSNGAFIMSLTNDTPGATTGTFSQGYVRVTSNVFPAGEIRGQLQVVPEPAAVVLFTIGGGLTMLAAWRTRRRSRDG